MTVIAYGSCDIPDIFPGCSSDLITSLHAMRGYLGSLHPAQMPNCKAYVYEHVKGLLG